jgi:tetratricopeptide (TPR) repeat protein
VTEKFFQFEEWYQKNHAHKPAEDRITWLEIEIEKTTEFWVKKCMFMHLLNSNVELSQFESALQVIDKEIQFDPDNALPLIAKAGVLLYHLERPAEALEVVEKGLLLSVKSKKFRRHALAVKARVAVQMGDYKMLEQILVSISELKLEKGDEDVGKEDDFFAKVDKSILSPDVVKKFETYLGR